MTIHLPKDVESSIEAAIHGGLFASVDDALAEAWRCLQQQRTTPPGSAETGDAANPPTPLHRKPIWEEIAEITASVPDSEWDKLPVDGAEQHDHYIYGTPKRQPAP